MHRGRKKKIMMKVLAWTCLLSLCVFASVSQAQDSACLNELVPCLQYINSKQTPSKSCCDPLRSLITNDPQCLCSMLGSNSATKQAGVNTTQAMRLPARCGDKVTASMCSSISGTKKKGSRSGAVFATPNVAILGAFSLMAQIVWMSVA